MFLPVSWLSAARVSQFFGKKCVPFSPKIPEKLMDDLMDGPSVIFLEINGRD